MPLETVTAVNWMLFTSLNFFVLQKLIYKYKRQPNYKQSYQSIYIYIYMASLPGLARLAIYTFVIPCIQDRWRGHLQQGSPIHSWCRYGTRFDQFDQNWQQCIVGYTVNQIKLCHITSDFVYTTKLACIKVALWCYTPKELHNIEVTCDTAKMYKTRNKSIRPTLMVIKTSMQPAYMIPKCFLKLHRLTAQTIHCERFFEEPIRTSQLRRPTRCMLS